MPHPRCLIALLSISSLAAVACGKTGKGETGATGKGPDPAIGGSASTDEQPLGGKGPVPEPPPGGAGGEAEGAGGACPELGSGELEIEILGLPEEVEADVLIRGSEQLEVAAGGTLTGVTAGGYAVTAARVYDADAIVRTAFDATVTTPDFCLAADGSQAITITYSAIPSSNKLWNTPFGQGPAAFEADAIAETGALGATVAIGRPWARGVAFDRDGNLWTLGGGTSSPDVMRFPAASLGTSGDREPDISITTPDTGCRPSFMNLAFDGEGNLWLSTACRDEVRRIPRSQLATSGDKEPDALLTGVTSPDGLAFDRHGNLWIDVPGGLARFDAARLGANDSDPADLKLSIMTTIHSWQVSPSGFAFDATGNLWGLDYASSLLFRLEPAILAGTGVRTVEAAAASVDVAGASAVPAFDEGGGLWLGMRAFSMDGALGRLSPEQLAMNGEGFLVPELLIRSASIAQGIQVPLAFFPAPQGLPLFHSLPAP